MSTLFALFIAFQAFVRHEQKTVLRRKQKLSQKLYLTMRVYFVCLALVFGASITSARQLLSRRRDGQGERSYLAPPVKLDALAQHEQVSNGWIRAHDGEVASFIQRLEKKRKKIKKKTKVKTEKLPAKSQKKPLSSSGTIQLPTNFNCECYLTRYQDLRNAFKNDCQKAQQHYVMNLGSTNAVDKASQKRHCGLHPNVVAIDLAVYLLQSSSFSSSLTRRVASVGFAS